MHLSLFADSMMFYMRDMFLHVLQNSTRKLLEQFNTFNKVAQHKSSKQNQ